MRNLRVVLDGELGRRQDMSPLRAGALLGPAQPGEGATRSGSQFPLEWIAHPVASTSAHSRRLRPFEFDGIERDQAPSCAASNTQSISAEYCKLPQFYRDYYFPCKINPLSSYSKHQKNISGILKGIFPMTDPKTVSTAAPEGPAEEVAMPAKPETAPVSPPEKSAPEASPTKQV